MNQKLLATLSKVAVVLALGAATARGEATNQTPIIAPKLWDGSAALGLTITRGNSRTLLFTGNVQATRKWEVKNELDLGADATYGENDGKKNAESVHGYAQYNRLFTDRFFGYLRLDGLHDAIADVDYRLTFSPGVGYYFIKSTNTTFRGEIGPGYVYEKKGGKTDDYFTLRLAERFDHKLNDHAKIWESVEFLPQVDRWGNYIINAELGVETGLTKTLSLRTFLQDTYHSEPAAGRVKNDLKLVAAVAYKF